MDHAHAHALEADRTTSAGATAGLVLSIIGLIAQGAVTISFLIGFLF